MLLLYGFGKIMGSQFTVLDSELDKPMRDVSGFWLTWYFFSYSAVYGTLIALMQIVGALLLTFQRTTLVGACILFALVTNIVLVDVFFGVDAGGLLMALLVWCGLLGILSWYRTPLLALFWHAWRPSEGAPRLRRAVAWGVRAGMILASAGFTYWAANYNNRAPTPLDGTWVVAAAEGFSGRRAPSRIYFERNRAHMAVFQYGDSATVHHFEVKPDEHRIQIWERWLEKDTDVFVGSYSLAEPNLRLTGDWGGTSAPVSLQLRRQR